MTNKEFINVKEEYKQAEEAQNKIKYKVMKFLSENILFKWLCCCLKVKDEVNIPWEEMTVPQRKYRVKRLWIKARLVYHFIRMK